MRCSIATARFALIIAGEFGLGIRADDEIESYKVAKVAAGTEFKLNPAEIVLAEKPDESGRYEVTVKPADEATLVKLQDVGWTLGFYPRAA